MDRKKLFNILRVLVSGGLIVFVCFQIRLRDHLILEDGVTVVKDGVSLHGQSEFHGYLQRSDSPDTFEIKTREFGTVPVERRQLKEQDGNLVGRSSGSVWCPLSGRCAGGCCCVCRGST